ncbi:MAG: hypothetical protein NTZ74_01565 [Chloroflexi bacterium]|nr:hypothetical protein [Chloroflexota bacterium]
MEQKSNWKLLVYILGGTAGLITGVAAAHILVRKQEQEQIDLKLSSGEGVKIGMGIVGLLKLISEIGKK